MTVLSSHSRKDVLHISRHSFGNQKRNEQNIPRRNQHFVKILENEKRFQKLQYVCNHQKQKQKSIKTLVVKTKI